MLFYDLITNKEEEWQNGKRCYTGTGSIFEDIAGI